MNQTLLVIGIGPVQEFIAASRKARDLWRGSSLLSEVSEVAAKALHDQGDDVKLIFPSAEALVARAGIANKLLV